MTKRKRKLLGAKDPKPVKVIAAPASNVILVCDHASNRVPEKLGNMGLSKKDLQKHIAWDPGTADIGKYLAKKMKVNAIFSSYSRLVADLNRGPRDADCMRKTYDKVDVPANMKISAIEKKQRLDEIYHPYHKAIGKMIKEVLRRKKTPVLISIHSFTPKMQGQKKRPWHVGILWNKEKKIAQAVIKEMRRQNPKIIIGDNEPYSMKKGVGTNTISMHADPRGLPHIVVEFRQDLVSSKKQADKWAEVFFRALQPVLDEIK